MKKIKFTIYVFIFSISSIAWGTQVWDLKAISQANEEKISLINQDKTPYKIISIKDAVTIVKIFDDMASLTGINPKILITDSDTYNAFMSENEDNYTASITYKMFDAISKDPEMASYLIGHELAHAYFHHGQKTKQTYDQMQTANFFAGLFLEIAFQRRLGVIGLGSDLSNIGTQMTFANFSRDQEREADRKGALWASSLGYSVNGQIRMFEFLKSKNGDSSSFFSTHPSNSERIESAKAFAIENKLINSKYYVIEKPTSEMIALQKSIEQYRQTLIPQTEIGKKSIEAFVKKDYLNAYELTSKCAIQGELICINNLGTLFEHGLGVEKNIKLAVEQYKLASDKGFAQGMTNFARVISLGYTGRIDGEEIYKLHMKASKLGEPNSMGYIALISTQNYLQKIQASERKKYGLKDMNSYVSNDQKLITNYSKISAANGIKSGMVALGNIYREGNELIPKNLATALLYYESSSKNNYPTGLAALGIFYLIDLNDKQKANQYFEKVFDSSPLTLTGSLIAFCNKQSSAFNIDDCLSWNKRGAELNLTAYMGSYGGFLILYGSPDQKIEGYAWANIGKNRGNLMAEDLLKRKPSNFSSEEEEKLKIKIKEIEFKYPNLTAIK